MGRGAEHVEVRMQPGKCPGGPVAKTLRSQSRGGGWVQSMVSELDPICHNSQINK